MPVHPQSAVALLEQVRAEGREWLDPAEAAAVLQVYGIPTVPTLRAEDAEAAVRAAGTLGYPVALKLVSPQVVHKSDIGGVALGLRDADELRAAASRMRETLARQRPDAQLRGFVVQAMAGRPGAQETILGIAGDPVFGPVLLFGAGGTSVEVRKDRALELPPVNAALAHGMVGRTQVGALLAGYRGQRGADRDALVDAIQRVSRMACDLEPLAELDINPLLVDADGVLALDARIRVGPRGRARLALRPYPSGLEESWLIGAERVQVRPIRPEDGERLAAFYAHASPGDLRLRFFHSRREVPRSELARYSQIDYEREMTFVALAGDRIVAEVRAVCDPDNVAAEFAIQVASSHQRRGLGRRLLHKLLGYLRARGTREVFGECLEENAGMVALARQEGFDVAAAQEGIVAMRRACTAT
jgi:acetyltransferase